MDVLEFLLAVIVVLLVFILLKWQGHNTSSHLEIRSEQQKASRIVRRPVGSPGEVRNVLRVVLIGKTGTGKSSTGNTILGSQDAFDPDQSFEAQTQLSRRKTGIVNDRKIQVVDTPGVFDTTRTPQEVEREIMKCLCLTSPGPHAFLFVIRLIDRFTVQEYAAYTMLKEMFGKNVVPNFMILVFTWGDQYKKPVREMLETAPEALKRILSEVGGRYVVLQNSGDLRSNDEQVLKLIENIENFRLAGNLCFENAFTKKIERRIQAKAWKMAHDAGIDFAQARENLLDSIERDKENVFLKDVANDVGFKAVWAAAAAACFALFTGGAGAVVLAGLAAEGAAVAFFSGVVSAAACSTLKEKSCSLM